MANHRGFRFGVVAAHASSAEEWVARARRAEELGFSTFLVPDTLGGTFAPLVALAVAASATRTIRLGTYVLANDFRNPLHVARECAALDFLSGGRFELGLGAGRPAVEEECRRLGIPAHSGGVRVERLAEALRLLKALLSGERVSAPGPHYAIAEAEVYPRPAQQPRPPILLAGGGKRLLSLAAQEADIVGVGVRPDAGHDDIQERIDWLREAAGSRFAQLELNINVFAVGQQLPPLTRFGIDLAQLIQSDSPFVLMGTPDEMCDKLLRLRESLGVSYITAADSLMEVLAPVVERLTGR